MAAMSSPSLSSTGAAALDTLGTDFDFFDVDPNDPKQLEAASEVIWSCKRLLNDVVTRGHDALRERIERLLARKVSSAELAALTARLSPENITVISEEWLPQLSQELSASGDSAGPSNKAAIEERNRDADRERVAAGGWFRDEMLLAIRYRPQGHADPWVTAWIDVLAELTRGQHANTARVLLKQWLKPSAAGQCGSCHTTDQEEKTHLTLHWLAKRAEGSNAQFTRFSHGPHLAQAQLDDCIGCHRMNPGSHEVATHDANSSEALVGGFHPLTKAACAECHRPGSAGDSCLQCHRYHVGQP